MKKLTPALAAILAAGLATSCSSTTEPAPSPVTETVTIATSSMTQKDLDKKVKQITGTGTATEENLKSECILAIGREDPQIGEMNFDDEPIEMKSVGGNPGVEVFTAGGNFKFTDPTGAWRKGAYSCQVITEEGVITESSAVVVPM